MQVVDYPRIVVIGLGGFWRTPRDIAFFLSFYSPATPLVLVDGKTYKPRHRNHECFGELGNKARVTAEWVGREFPELTCQAVSAFVGPERDDGVVAVSELIQPGDLVFAGVDTNRTKHVLDAHVRTLPDVTLISGGVADDLLRVQTYVRRSGVDISPPFSSYCHDIATPTDELPKPPCPGLHQMEEPVGSDVEHPFTLMAGSTFMLNAFYQVMCLDAGRLDRFVYDVWHNIRSAKTRAESVPVRAWSRGDEQAAKGEANAPVLAG